MPLEIVIMHRTTRRTSPAWLRPLLVKAARLSGVTSGEWVITIVNDASMKDLHKRSMNLNTTTDVLTFDLRSSKKDPFELNTVICADEAARRAQELGHATRYEILLYAVHSLLHVCGYDDLTPGKYKKMHAREDEILQKLGIGKIFAVSEKQPPKPKKTKAMAK